MSVKLGNCYQSPKHGRGQVVDVRSGRHGAPLWIVMYSDASFGSYYTERIEREFALLGTQPLPSGFPKIAAKLPNGSYMAGHKAVAYVNGRTPEFEERAATLQSRGFTRSQAIERAQAEVDGRPYHIVFVDFIKRTIIRKEVKR